MDYVFLFSLGLLLIIHYNKKKDDTYRRLSSLLLLQLRKKGKRENVDNVGTYSVLQRKVKLIENRGNS